MKIGVLSTAVYRNPPLKYGGTELVVYNQVKALYKNHEVTLITVNETPDIEGVNIIRCGSEGKITELDMYNKYKDKLNEFDILLDNSFEAYPYIFKKENPNSKVKIFHFFHSGIPFTSNPPIPKSELHYIAVSKWYASLLQDLYGVHVDYLYNGIDTSLYNPYKIEKKNYFLFLSILLPDKGILRTIELFKEFHKEHKDYELVIAGAKVNRPEFDNFNKLLTKEIVENADFIRYKGEVSFDEKVKLLREARALVLPLSYTRPEYFGLVYIEALASGTPVITIPYGSAYELSGIDYYSRGFNKTAFLLPITDEEFQTSFHSATTYTLKEYNECILYANAFNLEEYKRKLEYLITNDIDSYVRKYKIH